MVCGTMNEIIFTTIGAGKTMNTIEFGMPNNCVINGRKLDYSTEMTHEVCDGL